MVVYTLIQMISVPSIITQTKVKGLKETKRNKDRGTGKGIYSKERQKENRLKCEEWLWILILHNLQVTAD